MLSVLLWKTLLIVYNTVVLVPGDELQLEASLWTLVLTCTERQGFAQHKFVTPAHTAKDYTYTEGVSMEAQP